MLVGLVHPPQKKIRAANKRNQEARSVEKRERQNELRNGKIIVAGTVVMKRGKSQTG